MKDDFDNKMKNLFKQEFHKPASFDYNIKNFSYKSSRKKIIMQFATATVGLLICSGVVFAASLNINKTKKENERGLGKGIDTAIKNGYIAEPDMDYIEQETSVESKGIVTDNVNTQIKINNFLMDDYNISTEFEVVFEENLNEYIEFSKIHHIVLKDLAIHDEENRILNERSGLNNFITSRIEDTQTINLMYNVYGGVFPKSKQLNFSFHKIILTEEGVYENDERAIILTGDWEINVDVPEEMYNRIEEYYKVVSCDNNDFQIHTAKVSDTGFEIGLIVNNTRDSKEEIMKETREIWKNWDESNDAESRKLIAKQLLKNHIIDVNGDYFVLEKEANGEEQIDISTIPDTKSYIENENGDKFYCTMSPGRKYDRQYLEENQYNFYETFELTKTTATDKIKVVLYYYGEPITIELEKIK